MNIIPQFISHIFVVIYKRAFTTFAFATVLIVSLTMCNISQLSAAIQPTLRFEKIRVNGEVYDEMVRFSVQDRQGFLWFSTDNGLVRYDGYTTKRYKHDPDNPNSISSNRVRAILESRDGMLWIGTSNSGLNSFDPETEVFTHYISGKIAESNVLHIFEDSLGIIWISTSDNGLFKMNPKTKRFTQYMPNRDSPTSIIHHNVRKVLEDPDRNLWIATKQGLDYFERDKQSFTHYKQNENDSTTLDGMDVKDLYYTRDGTLWIGTQKGLNQFNPSTKKFLRLYPDEKNKHQRDDDNIVMSIHEDEHGRLWIGTFGGGIKLYDRKLKHFSSYLHDSYDRYSIHDNQVRRQGILEDNSGLLWILTYNGITRLNLAATNFRNYRHENDNSDSLSSNIIWDIYEDSDAHLWIATDDKGLNRFDEVKKEFLHYRFDPQDPTSLSSDRVFSILVDKEETLWVGTDKGLNRLDKNQTKFQRYRFDPENLVGISGDRIFGLLEDHRGNIWIGTTNGLRKYDKKTNRSVLYTHKKGQQGSISNNWIMVLYQDRLKRLWVGSKGGLDLYDPDNESFSHIKHDYKRQSGSDYNAVRAVCHSKNGLIWVGGNGLSSLNLENDQIKHYSKNDGLPNDKVMAIIEDEKGFLWITTEGGLSRFSPATETFRNFTDEDGSQDIYTSFASVRRDSGEIVVGGLEGINLFYPDSVTDKPKAPVPVLTDFLISNRSVPTFSNSTTKQKIQSNAEEIFYLEKSISHEQQITLNHKASIFSLEFSALDYLNPNKTQYAYQLQGFEQDWTVVSARKRSAHYMNIPPGNYQFTVKAGNKNGVWSDRSRTLNITILPPFWLTWWAKIIYIVLFLTLLVSFYHFRTASLRRRASSLEHMVTSRTKALADEKHKVEQLLSLKNEEFANVSHEFRTPLTLILGPLNRLLSSNKNPDEIVRLNIIQRNGYRLLRMVDQLLNLETFRVKNITQKTSQAIGKTIGLVAEAFIDLAKQKNIQFTIIGIVDINFDFTADALEKIVLNLLSNAVKYTKSGGSIELETIRTNSNQIKIQVKDSGIGIPPDQLDSIFERYNRVLDANSEQVTGAGIGLALVKSLVESHQGSIEIQSKLGSGTIIDVYLPIINEVNDAQVNLHGNDEIIAMELMSLTGQSKTDEDTSIDEIDVIEKNSNKPSLLVIEDNKDMRNYIVESIRGDYRVITANDGEEGLKLAISEIPDLIISDIMMPKMDGYETTHQLRKNQLTNHIPIILLTARGDRESRLKGWLEKADEYLTKPFDTEELKIRLNNLLEIRNILKKSFAERTFKEINESDKSLKQPTLDTELNRNKQQEIFVAKINLLLEKLFSEPTTSIADISAKLAMSERQLFRKMKSILDMTPAEYLRRFRLEKSKIILAEGKNVTYTAFEVGFSTQSSFTKCFTAQFGLSPKNYTKSISTIG